MERKDFIKLLGVSASGFLLQSCATGKAFTTKEIEKNDFENVIIGTGYGAAVVALRLAQSGHKCVMLEMGLDWQKAKIPFSGMAWAKKQSTWLKNNSIAPFGNYRVFKKFTGALDRIDFEHVKVYAGRGVGGGSLVNGGITATPKKSYFEEIFPFLDSNAFYNKYFPLANKELGAHDIPKEFYNKSEYYKFSRVGEKEAKNAGFKTIRVPNIYDFEYMQREEKDEVPKSALNQEVIYGNNYGKKDLTKTYLKEALATGNVTILSQHKVTNIRKTSNDKSIVEVDLINTKGETIAQKEITTTKLFMCAGSLGTTELLLKAKTSNTINTNNELGKYWGNNGNVMSGRNFIKGGTGVKQSTIPVAAIDGWTKDINAFFAEIAPLPIGMETWAALYLVINRLKKYGEFTYNTTTKELELDWNESHNTHMKKNVENFIETMNKHNGGTIAGLLFDKGIGTDICYHPLGGCVLNKATDRFGRLNNNKNIYVLDGSLIPGTIGVNPYVTITAIAEYCIEEIVKKDFS